MMLKCDRLDIMQDVINGGFVISLHVDAIPSGAEKLREGPLSVSITKWRARRTLTANAYYWTLVTKIADTTHLSNACVHNMLLRRYGVPELMDGELLTVLVPDDQEKEILEKEIYHLKPTSHTKPGKAGKYFRVYILLKGSSDFDTKEFSTLLEGTIQEAKDIGIETLPPDEIDRMKADYEKHYGK